MNIRVFTESDLAELKRLHALHFANEFALPNFMDMLTAFVIEDEKGVVTFGGVRDIAECIAITNMDRYSKHRAQALYKLLDASTFVCKNNKYDQMFIWSQNEPYTRRLVQNGFRYPAGQSLILDL